MWGGIVPDVSAALVLLLARLFDRDGRCAIGLAEVDEERRAAGRQVPLDADVIRAYLAARREILREEGIAPEPLESAVRDSAHGGALLRRFAALLDA